MKKKYFTFQEYTSTRYDDDNTSSSSSGTEPIIIYEEWYKNQTVCGEEYVDTCCTNFAKPGDCIDFDFDDICKVIV